MVTAIQDLPPIAIAAGTNFQPLFKEAFNEPKEKKTKEVQKNDDNQILKSDNETNKDKKETENIKKADFSKLTEKLKGYSDDPNLSLEFTVDKDTKKMIIKVVNQETKEVVHQYPPEVSLKIARFVANTLDNGNVTNARI